MSVENYLPGDLCSGLIICWRKSSGEMSPGEKFLGEKCDEFKSFPPQTIVAQGKNGSVPQRFLPH